MEKEENAACSPFEMSLYFIFMFAASATTTATIMYFLETIFPTKNPFRLMSIIIVLSCFWAYYLVSSKKHSYWFIAASAGGNMFGVMAILFF